VRPEGEPLEGDETALGVSYGFEAGAEVAIPRITLWACPGGVYEGHHAQLGYFPVFAGEADGFADQLAREMRSFVAKETVHPGAGPRVADILRERPGGNPEGVCGGSEKDETPPGRHELR